MGFLPQIHAYKGAGQLKSKFLALQCGVQNEKRPVLVRAKPSAH
jgi:hypothetical protein